MKHQCMPGIENYTHERYASFRSSAEMRIDSHRIIEDRLIIAFEWLNDEQLVALPYGGAEDAIIKSVKDKGMPIHNDLLAYHEKSLTKSAGSLAKNMIAWDAVAFGVAKVSNPLGIYGPSTYALHVVDGIGLVLRSLERRYDTDDRQKVIDALGSMVNTFGGIVRLQVPELTPNIYACDTPDNETT